MRPSSPGPTGTRTTSPVPVTRSPPRWPRCRRAGRSRSSSASRVSANPIRPPSKRRSSLRQASGRPETRAIPSPTRLHAAHRLGLRREIDRGDSLAAAREPGSSRVSGSVCVMMNQLPDLRRTRSARKLLRTTACGASNSMPAISSGSTRDLDQNRMSEDSAIALRQASTSSGVTARATVRSDRRAIRAAAMLGFPPEACQSLRNPIDKGRDPRLVRQSIEQLAGDIDCKPPRPIVAASPLCGARLRSRPRRATRSLSASA